MSDQPILTAPPNIPEIQAETEAVIVGDLLGPFGLKSVGPSRCKMSNCRHAGSEQAGTPSDTDTDEYEKEDNETSKPFIESAADGIGTLIKYVPILPR